jgi:hypothetical protein
MSAVVRSQDYAGIWQRLTYSFMVAVLFGGCEPSHRQAEERCHNHHQNLKVPAMEPNPSRSQNGASPIRQPGQLTPGVAPTPATIDDKLFDDVELNASVSNRCTPPEPEDFDWVGILIRAPRRVTFTPGKTFGISNVFARIPICGFYMYPVTLKTPSRDEAMKCVVKDQETGVVYQGVVRDMSIDDPAPDPEPAEIDPKDLEGLVSGGYFNLNLAEQVQLPPRPCRYLVYVEGGGYRSNVVSIEIVRAD